MDPRPVSDIDIHRAAHELVRRFGWLTALVGTAQCIRDLAEAGDEAGVGVWGRVMDAVEEAIRLTPGGGQSVH
jgi:ribulose kinase